MLLVILLAINRPCYLLSLRNVLISVTYQAMDAIKQENEVKDAVLTIGQIHRFLLISSKSSHLKGCHLHFYLINDLKDELIIRILSIYWLIKYFVALMLIEIFEKK